MFTLFKEDKDMVSKFSLEVIEALVESLKIDILEQHNKLKDNVKKDSSEKRDCLSAAFYAMEVFKATYKKEEKDIEKALVTLMMELHKTVTDSKKIAHTGKLSGSLAKVGVSIDSDTTKILTKACKEVGSIIKAIGYNRNMEKINDAGEWFEKHDPSRRPSK